VIDGGLPGSERDAVIAAARARTPVPYIMVATGNPSEAVKGADTVAARPETLNQARTLVERCIRTRVPTRVLVVDDSSTMRSIVKKVLSASHYAMEVSEASDGVECIEKVKRSFYELVILDFNMPGQSGMDVLTAIKKMNASICVVMMTTEVDAVVAKRVQMAGAAGILKKPFFPADIDNVLDRFFATQMGHA
jgi:CheY-like chemotaxis protein